MYASPELAAAAAKGPVVMVSSTRGGPFATGPSRPVQVHTLLSCHVIGTRMAHRLRLSTIQLHLGVDVRAAGFKLEQQAANDATFRVPDQRGWQPSRQLIDDSPGCTLSTQLRTDLDLVQLAGQACVRRGGSRRGRRVAAADGPRCQFSAPCGSCHICAGRMLARPACMAARLASRPPMPKPAVPVLPQRLCAAQLAGQQRHNVAVSRDAGRFVCNYTYYLSLLHCCTARQRHGAPLHALFVHVPPAAVVPLQQQFEFLLAVLAAVAAALAPAVSSVEGEPGIASQAAVRAATEHADDADRGAAADAGPESVAVAAGAPA